MYIDFNNEIYQCMQTEDVTGIFRPDGSLLWEMKKRYAIYTPECVVIGKSDIFYTPNENNFINLWTGIEYTVPGEIIGCQNSYIYVLNHGTISMRSIFDPDTILKTWSVRWNASVLGIQMVDEDTIVYTLNEYPNTLRNYVQNTHAGTSLSYLGDTKVVYLDSTITVAWCLHENRYKVYVTGENIQLTEVRIPTDNDINHFVVGKHIIIQREFLAMLVDFNGKVLDSHEYSQSRRYFHIRNRRLIPCI